MLGLAAARAVLAVVAIPLAPVLYHRNVELLVLLRPSKEVLLFAGYWLEEDDISPLLVVPFALPLLLGGVWVMFALGRAYAGHLGEERGGVAGRVLPPERMERLVAAVEERGTTLVLLGRLAAFPSTLVGAAAGAAGMPARRFVVADTAGALVSMSVLLALGVVLEDAYEDAGPWLTGAGVAVLAAGVVLLGRALSRAGGRGRPRPEGAS